MSADNLRMAKAGRLHSLDALRSFALLSGVALHATMAFLPNVQLWIIREQPSQALALLFYVVHIFRMPVFFLLAGYFARLLLARRGTAGFIRDRAVRIAAPFLVFYPLVGAATIACAIWAMRVTGQKFVVAGGAGAARPQLSLASVPLTHLWFLYVLLLFYSAALLARMLFCSFDRDRRRSGAAVDHAMRWLAATPLASLLLAFPLACIFILTPNWRPWLGIAPPAFGLVPNGAALVGYGMAFCFGWLLRRQSVLMDLLARGWSVQIGIALAATAFCIVRIGLHPSMEYAPHSTLLDIYAACYALAVWAWTLGLTGAAVRFLGTERPAIRYLSEGSYWIYIVHIPVLAAIQILLHPLGLPPLAGYALLLASLAVILPLSYELLVRHSFIGKWLNGRSHPWRGMARWKIGAATMAAALLVTFLVTNRPAAAAGYENGIFRNDCCGTLELRNGEMVLNDKPAVRYVVGRDARGPYVLPHSYVGGFEQIGFEIDGTRQVTRLRLDRIPHPTRIIVYGGSKPYLFERTGR